MEYLVNKRKIPVKVYRFLYVAAVFIGPFLSVEAVWNIADIMNGLMAFPNLVALFCLSGVVVKETNRFRSHLSAEHLQEEARRRRNEL